MKIGIKDKTGVTLKTAGKYCKEDISVTPLYDESAKIVSGEESIVLNGEYDGSGITLSENSVYNVRDLLAQKKIPLNVTVDVQTNSENANTEDSVYGVGLTQINRSDSKYITFIVCAGRGSEQNTNKVNSCKVYCGLTDSDCTNLIATYNLNQTQNLASNPSAYIVNVPLSLTSGYKTIKLEPEYESSSRKLITLISVGVTVSTMVIDSNSDVIYLDDYISDSSSYHMVLYMAY